MNSLRPLQWRKGANDSIYGLVADVFGHLTFFVGNSSPSKHYAELFYESKGTYTIIWQTFYLPTEAEAILACEQYRLELLQNELSSEGQEAINF